MFNAQKKSQNKKRGRKLKEVKKPEDEFEQKIIDLDRVTRVTSGGKRLGFRACVAIGNKKGKVGVGVAKGRDVTDAINKAVLQAKKNIVNVQIVKNTIPHEMKTKYSAARIILKPLKTGAGIIAGGPIRGILELSGLENVSAKILGSKNKINNARALIKSFELLNKMASKREENKI
jgi:small subunit ribosomal protein S5